MSRAFGCLWLSNLFFFGSTWMLTLVLGWLIYDETRSAVLLGAFGVLRTLPLLLGPMAGVLADQVHRVGLLLALTGWACLAVATVAVCASSGIADVRIYLAAGLAIGLAHSPAQPARFALVSEYVDRRSLARANAWNTMAINMTQIVGPTLGGVLIHALGSAAALWIAAACYLGAILTLIPLRNTGRRSSPRRRGSVLTDLREGVALVSRIPEAVGLLQITVLANLLLWPVYQSLMPLFAGDRLHLGPRGLALLLTSAGVGGLAGSLLIARWGDVRGKGALFTGGTVACALSWMLFALSSHPALGMSLMFIAGLFSAPFMVLQATLLLLVVPAPAHGRAFGLLELGIASQPLGALVLGVVASRLGISLTVALSSAALAVLTLLIAVMHPALPRYP